MKGSLKLKTMLTTLIAALLLMAAAAAISYQVYSGTIRRQYKTMTMNLAKTEAVTVNAEDVAEVRDEVMKIYRNICRDNGGVPDFGNFTQEQWEAYYQNFENVPQMPAYKRTLQLLHEISNANDINSIYIGYMDVETYYGIYLVDGSLNAEACLPGACDPFEKSNAEQMKKGNYDFPAYITNYEEYGWLCSAGAGIYDDDGEVVGTAMLDISMDAVMKNLHEFLFNLCLVLTMITVVICLVILYGINKTLLLPVKSLSEAASSFVSEKEKNSTEKVQSAISRLDIHTGDEIEELSDSIKTMEKEINDYIDHLTEVTAEKERMGAELNIAKQIQASMLLLSNTGNTFVTPVFNGSASLRDAAGQLIESVTKSVRRKETVDDAYMDRLFDDVASLYHLDEVKAQTSGKTDLGPLPWTARVLVGGLILSWVLILLWAFRDILKKRTQNH